jgi:hypothetical protein
MTDQQGRCATCKWWDTEDMALRVFGYPAREEPPHACTLASGELRSRWNNYEGMDREFGNLAIATCAHEGGIDAELMTLAHFGCIQWQARP